MSDDTVIEIENISKAYPLYKKPMDIIKEMVFGGIRHDLFWALRNVSFSVRTGQRIGIIGPNGAGKSTLLQIIAGNLQPTSGSLQVNGSISALLSLVPAWNLEQTGIENIRFNMLLRGCSTSQIAELTEDIVDFAELGPFIYQPVKTYSSGMSARLSFAIATAISPEILIVDEVLGAGDGYFAGKATRRMKEMCDKGKAMLLVSHSLSSVQQMCDTVIWLHHGKIRMIDGAEYVLHRYERDFRIAEDESLRSSHAIAANKTNVIARPEEILAEDRLRLRIITENRERFSSTHYIRSIRVGGHSEYKSIEVPLEMYDIEQVDTQAVLDTMSSEWGRIYERCGQLTRILSRMAGKNHGGHLIIKLPDSADGFLSLRVDIVEEHDFGSDEELSLDFLDPETGEWKQADVLEKKKAYSSIDYSFAVKVNIPERHVFKEVQKKVAVYNLPEAEVVGVDLLQDAKSTVLIRERCPFEIAVKVKFNKQIEIANVNLTITRSDGVHVFWQTTGLEGPDLIRPLGIKRIRFQFDRGIFGGGEYSVKISVANGWNYPDNWPYSHVYTRLIDAIKFRVFPEYAGVNCGVANIRIPIIIEDNKEVG